MSIGTAHERDRMIDWLRREAIDPQIDLGERTIPIALKRHPRARRLTLRLAPDGTEVRITLPSWCASKEALAFVHARKDWLEGELAKIPERSPPEHGSTIQFRGNEVIVEWDEGHPRRPKLKDNKVAVGGPKDGLERRLQRWLESEARLLLQGDLEHYCAKAGVNLPGLALSRAQRRWGSCSTSGTVRINWRLVQAPDAVRRSVVAHEVAHLVHFDHSPAFKALLDQLFEDDIQIADQWLKNNGRILYASFG
ncbi:M48 family metallopeptidase [Altererythrobacter sp. MF3-039]